MDVWSHLSAVLYAKQSQWCTHVSWKPVDLPFAIHVQVLISRSEALVQLQLYHQPQLSCEKSISNELFIKLPIKLFLSIISLKFF